MAIHSSVCVKIIVFAAVLLCKVSAFMNVDTKILTRRKLVFSKITEPSTKFCSGFCLGSAPASQEDELAAPTNQEDAFQYVERGSENDPLTEEEWSDIVKNAPPKWKVMKDILGIGPFTYVLVGLIVIMLTLNFTLGPGWLGSTLGIDGAGTFIDDNFPTGGAFDLSKDEYLLPPP